MWMHDYQAVLDPFEGVPLICTREVCTHKCNEIERDLETGCAESTE